MENEELKLDEKEETKVVDEDDDFADAHADEVKAMIEESAPAEEPKKEEKPVDPLQDEEQMAEPEEEPEPEKGAYEYEDVRLQTIEEGRQTWTKNYRKWQKWKIGVTCIALVIIIVGWLVPTTLIKDNATLALGISLAVAVVAIVGILVFSSFQKKHDRLAIQEYFNAYYNSLNSYTLGEDVVVTGNVDNKITKEEFMESGLFPSSAQVGSRANVTFNWKGMDCALVDCASQKEGRRGLEVLFVGKYLRTHNTVECSDEGIVVYIKGRSSLHPEGLDKKNVLEQTKQFIVYGNHEDKKYLTGKMKAALREIRTDKLLVDVAITIKPGKTYWCLGYEDALMVLPNEKPFNPKYVMQYKDQIQTILDAALVMNGANID